LTGNLRIKGDNVASILGNRVVRVEDPRMLTEGGMYVEDVAMPNAVHVTFVRSQFAHGTILSIDTADAADMPGVLGIFTGAQLDLPPFPHVNPMYPAGCERPLLARDRVRFVGEAIAAVVAETKAQATDAAEMVFVDIDPLPAVIELDDALSDAMLLHPEVGSNTYMKFASPNQADFGGCDVVLNLRVMNQRIAGAPLETRSGMAYWEGDRLVHYSSCQGAHPTKEILGKIYGLAPEQIRAVVPDVGGGFGVKSRTIGEELTLGWLSKKVNRPVRFTETRTESMQAMPQGRGQRMDITIGGTRDGRVTAYQLEVVQDAGAYPLMGAFLPAMTQRMVPGVYDIPNCGFNGVSVATNKMSVTAYRGAGRPEAALAIERAMDYYAAEIGMDPAEVRRRNFIPKFTEAYTTGIGNVYDVGDYPEAMSKVLKAADYESLRAEQVRRRADGDGPLMGIGLSVYVEITSGGPGVEHGSVHLLADGRLKAVSGATPYGQGHDTTWKMIVSDRAGVSMDDVDVVHGDTDTVPSGGLTVGSRSVQVAGSSLADATEKLVVLARQRAADILEASFEDVVLDEGGFHVVGSPTPAVGWSEVAAAPGEPLVGISDFKAVSPTYPFGAHVAVVDVDRDTGKVVLKRIIAVDDAGTLINPLLAEGQFHGGLAQGIAQALMEWQQFDDQGNPVTSNFADYPVISAAELPSFEMVHMETPTWVNPLGAKGAGESGTIGSIPAVLNAVVDALSPLGVRHIDGPTTPERVWNAINAAR
jgi:aerobic carbon-monoxide dehydrogenase large subunit